MPDDPHPIEPGARGTVIEVVDLTRLGPPRAWQVWMEWDSGSKLALIVPPDRFKKV